MVNLLLPDIILEFKKAMHPYETKILEDSVPKDVMYAMIHLQRGYTIARSDLKIQGDYLNLLKWSTLLILKHIEVKLLKPVKKHDIGQEIGLSLFDTFGLCLCIIFWKDRAYGSEWCDDGDKSAFNNVKRKFKRLESIFDKDLPLSGNETGIDTIIDTGNYCTLWASIQDKNLLVSYVKKLSEELISGC